MNAFFRRIPNIVTKYQNVDIFLHFLRWGHAENSEDLVEIILHVLNYSMFSLTLCTFLFFFFFQQYKFNNLTYMTFKMITMVPLEPNLIDFSLLSAKQVKYEFEAYLGLNARNIQTKRANQYWVSIVGMTQLNVAYTNCIRPHLKFCI